MNTSNTPIDPIMFPSNPILTSYKPDGTLEADKTITNFNEYLDLILSSIGIKDGNPSKDTIKAKFNNYKGKIYTIMNNPVLKTLIDSLLKADKDFNQVLFEPRMGLKEYYDNNTTDFKKNWDKLMEQFVTLQALIIIKKIDKDINSGIDSIIDALTNKLTAVNKLVEQNLF